MSTPLSYPPRPKVNKGRPRSMRVESSSVDIVDAGPAASTLAPNDPPPSKRVYFMRSPCKMHLIPPLPAQCTNYRLGGTKLGWIQMLELNALNRLFPYTQNRTW